MHLVIENGGHFQQLATGLSWLLAGGAGYGFVRLCLDVWQQFRRQDLAPFVAASHEKPPAP